MTPDELNRLSALESLVERLAERNRTQTDAINLNQRRCAFLKETHEAYVNSERARREREKDRRRARWVLFISIGQVSIMIGVVAWWFEWWWFQ